MSHSNKTAILVGATGLVGTELLQILLNSKEYIKVTVLTRKKLNIEHTKLHQVMIDFAKLSSYKEYFEVDDVYCCLGTTIKKAGSQEAFRIVDYEYPVTLAKLSKECKVEKFLIITAMGADKFSKIFYNRVKGEVEDAIKEIELHALYFFRPSLLLGNRKEFRFGERFATVLSPLFSFLLSGPLEKYKPIHARNVALAMYNTSRNGSKGIHTYLSNQIQDLSNKF